MRILPLTACALAFALPAKADKFWLSDPATQPEGSTPNYIHGVLLAEEGDAWRIRIVGGEVVLPKQAVFSVEKDDLTVDAITAAEKDAAEALAAANRERELQQEIARKERELRLAERAAKRSAQPAEASARPVAPAPAPAYDPVLDVVPPAGLAELQRAARIAFEQTGDRAYLRELRRLRRLR
jgi:hypothetical protein